MSARDLRPGRPRIFGIGLNKTATTTLHTALGILGVESLHWGGPEVRRTVERSLAEGRPALADLDPRFDAFSDIEPIYTNYATVDEQYPGSRFVLTLRPIDDWIDSRRRHVERNIRRAAAGEYHGTFLEVDEPAWRRAWREHVSGVRRHFEGRSEFLEIDLTAGRGWQPLCSFLGVDEPDEPFPWANRGSDVSPPAP